LHRHSPTSRDFVPWRFSDAGPSQSCPQRCRRPRNLHTSGLGADVAMTLDQIIDANVIGDGTPDNIGFARKFYAVLRTRERDGKKVKVHVIPDSVVRIWALFNDV
jgi:hypothetical protein